LLQTKRGVFIPSWYACLGLIGFSGFAGAHESLHRTRPVPYNPPVDLKDLLADFASGLALATATEPLIVCFDSLDQLLPNNNARKVSEDVLIVSLSINATRGSL
jgi:hypothetical protein